VLAGEAVETRPVVGQIDADARDAAAGTC
jgi:hypothetical protein